MLDSEMRGPVESCYAVPGNPYSFLSIMQLKRDSPTNVIAAIEAIENRGDACWDNLELYSFPRETASWAILVSLVLTTERERQKRGDRNLDVILMNLSLRGALALRWVRERGKDAASDDQVFTWTDSLARAVDQALAIAANYQVFLDCLPMWHQNKEFAELLSESVVRFTVPGGAPARRISAFQKGFRPGLDQNQNKGLVLSPEQARESDAALSRCFYAGHLSMAYPEPTELYGSLLPSYRNRINAMFRRADSVNLGPYDLGELKQAYAALSTIFAVHEDFCFRYGLKYEYPVNSCVMMRNQDDWASLIAKTVGIEKSKCSAILDDLTVSDRFWDLHVQPFIPAGKNVLAVAPQFPLHSRADENILRVCNHRRRPYFDASSLLKEQEMFDDFIPVCPEGYSPNTRISLPDGLPNIDLMLADEDSRTVIVAELKWLQKPSAHWKERIHREEDFGKGLQQLTDIRTFLRKTPTFLSGRGKLKRPFSEYEHVAFVLVARDFFLWPESEDIILVDYDAFKEMVAQTTNLAALIDNLTAYDWLPVEGKHFRVAYEPVALNGVTLESETFYRI